MNNPLSDRLIDHARCYGAVDAAVALLEAIALRVKRWPAPQRSGWLKHQPHHHTGSAREMLEQVDQALRVGKSPVAAAHVALSFILHQVPGPAERQPSMPEPALRRYLVDALDQQITLLRLRQAELARFYVSQAEATADTVLVLGINPAIEQALRLQGTWGWQPGRIAVVQGDDQANVTDRQVARLRQGLALPARVQPVTVSAAAAYLESVACHVLIAPLGITQDSHCVGPEGVDLILPLAHAAAQPVTLFADVYDLFCCYVPEPSHHWPITYGGGRERCVTPWGWMRLDSATDIFLNGRWPSTNGE
jgi:hypothetical protein